MHKVMPGFTQIMRDRVRHPGVKFVQHAMVVKYRTNVTTTVKMGTILSKRGLFFVTFSTSTHVHAFTQIYIFFSTLGKQNFEQEVPKFKIVVVGMYQFYT